MTNSTWLSIRYRDFYDVPRCILVEYRGRHYLFDCPFDDSSDEYPDRYTVYALSTESLSDINTVDWNQISRKGTPIGDVLVSDVEFDETKRQAISAKIFDGLKLV